MTARSNRRRTALALALAASAITPAAASARFELDPTTPSQQPASQLTPNQIAALRSGTPPKRSNSIRRRRRRPAHLRFRSSGSRRTAPGSAGAMPVSARQPALGCRLSSSAQVPPARGAATPAPVESARRLADLQR
jgi:hypothetical protein